MLVVDSISFGYTDKNVIENISFSLKKGEHLSVIGESGCGKSTLLKALYGFFDLSNGKIFLDNEELKGRSYYLVIGHLKMKYLAQDFGLMPYISVSENVGKYLSNLNLKKKQERITELLEMVGMQQYANEKPLHLSGGQQQRVALAMNIAKEPEVLLLDEPFSQVDSFQKNRLRRNLFNYLKEKHITCIVATHDSDDALSFSDHIMVMQQGKCIAFSSPQEIYQQKENHYIASLFEDVSAIETDNKKQLFYPHQIAVCDYSSIKVKVVNCYFKGTHYLLHTQANGSPIFVNHSKKIERNTEIFIKILER